MGDDCNCSLHEVSTNMMSSYKNTSGELSITCSKRDDSDLYPVTCEICLSPVDISDPCNSVVNLSCNHCTCYACWLDYMRVHVTKERKCTVECPVYQCEQILSSYKVQINDRFWNKNISRSYAIVFCFAKSLFTYLNFENHVNMKKFLINNTFSITNRSYLENFVRYQS